MDHLFYLEKFYATTSRPPWGIYNKIVRQYQQANKIIQIGQVNTTHVN